MINNKEELKECLSYEMHKYNLSGKLITFIKRFCGSEQAIIWSWQRRLRLTEYYKNSNFRLRYLYSKNILNHMSNKYGLHIAPNVCERGLKIMHLGPVLANGNVKMGRDVSIHINTSFVAKGTSDEAPIIGNGCVIGVGAVIIGGVRIADNVAVGANAVVCKDIMEENIAIAGIPARKVSENGRLNWN